MPLRLIAACLLALALSPTGRPAIAQVRDSTGVAPDSTLPAPDSTDTRRDSVRAARDMILPDSAAAADTGAAPLLRGAGSIDAGTMPVTVLSDTGARFVPYRSAGDVVNRIDGSFVTTAGTGEIGRKFSVNGLREGSVAFLADGMLLNSPATGLYDPNLYPMGFAERIEFASGPTAFTSGLNAVGGTMNFVSRALRAVRPVSRLFYTQSAYNLTIVDAALRQDVAKGVNVALGIERPVADGRYQNSAFDAWNSRLKVRYDFAGGAAYASDIYNRWERGLNDGVSLKTPDSLWYDPIRSDVVNPSAMEKIVRHDAAAGVTAGSDTTALTGLDIQYSSAWREYRDEAGGGSTGAPFREAREEQTSGARLSHSGSFAGNRFSAAVEYRDRRIVSDPNIGTADSKQAAASASLRLVPFPFLAIIPSVRYERFLGLDRFSYNVSGEARLLRWLTAVGGFSRSYRYPSFAEVNGVTAFAAPLIAPDPERHDVATAGILAGEPSGSHASLTFFHRGILDGIILDSSRAAGAPPLTYGRTGYETRGGATLSGALRVGGFVAEINAGYLTYGDGARRRYAPEWDVRGGVYFDDRIVDGNLHLRTGFRGRHFTSFDAEGYMERYGLFVPSGFTAAPAETVDFIFFAGIGDAVIHLVWENLLGANYEMTVLYPADDRSFRIGVDWNFLN